MFDKLKKFAVNIPTTRKFMIMNNYEDNTVTEIKNLLCSKLDRSELRKEVKSTKNFNVYFYCKLKL